MRPRARLSAVAAIASLAVALGAGLAAPRTAGATVSAAELATRLQKLEQRKTRTFLELLFI